MLQFRGPGLVWRAGRVSHAAWRSGPPQRAVEWLRRCAALADALGVFSRNEELDDLATGDLRFLALPKLLGDLLARTPLRAPGPRAAVLEQAAAEYARWPRPAGASPDTRL